MFKIGKIYPSRAMMYCPYHKSEKGTPDLDVTLEGQWAGMWFCWSCKKSGKISDEELDKLRSMRGESSKKTVYKDWTQRNTRYLKNRVEKGLARPWNISPYNMSLLQWGWDDELSCDTFPMRNERDEITGIHRRWKNGNKGMLGNLGLFIPRLNWKHDEPLYITEGVSDLAVILEMNRQGIGRPNANSCVEMLIQWLCLHGWKGEIILIADNDQTGQDGAEELYRQLYNVPLEEGGKAFSIEMRTPPTKDLRQMYETQGKKETLRWLN
jgi:hypothetical protein